MSPRHATEKLDLYLAYIDLINEANTVEKMIPLAKQLEALFHRSKERLRELTDLHDLKTETISRGKKK